MGEKWPELTPRSYEPQDPELVEWWSTLEKDIQRSMIDEFKAMERNQRAMSSPLLDPWLRAKREKMEVYKRKP
jgi:hypothetical protein